MGTEYNSVALAPNFNPHRVSKSAVDSSNPTTQKSGANAYGFDKAIVELKLVSGTLGQCDIELLFWSPGSSKYVPSSPPKQASFTEAGQATFDVEGRQFFVKITTLNGTSPVVTLNVAGAVPHSGQ